MVWFHFEKILKIKPNCWRYHRLKQFFDQKPVQTEQITPQLKHLSNQFRQKTLVNSAILSIEVAQSKDGLVISQHKYAMDILEETGLLNAKPVDALMDPSVKLRPNQGKSQFDSGRYRRLVAKLNYLTVTRPDISFAINVVCQFLNSPCQDHMEVVIRILRYIKCALGKDLVYEDIGHIQIVGYSDAD